MENQPKIEVGVMIRDLIFETKIKSTAQALGIGAAVVRNVNELATLLSQTAIRLLIVDLNTAGPTAFDAVRAAKAHPGVRVLAFVSHVDTDLANLATEAGADEVLPRSRFTSQLPKLLSQCRDPP